MILAGMCDLDVICAAEPATTSVSKVPQDYLERVRRTHESGGYGSEG